VPDRPTKPCTVCGRDIQWRKKWERDWDTVKYCSDACRRNKDNPAADSLEAAILALLAQRPKDATICPSEAARAIDPTSWRALMEPARQAARRLVAKGAIDITQQGRVVDPSTAKGAIRLRRR
jgi:hypothetical protein